MSESKNYMCRTLIIDDDQLAVRVLKRILEQNFEDINIVGEADSVATGLLLINELDPELVFLDIEMPDGTGFDLLQKLNRIDFKVVFTTSYSDYAIKAFKYSAFDYIVKPVMIEDIKSTINRIKEIPAKVEKQQIEVLKKNLSNDAETEPTIALPELTGFSFVKISEIVRCESERNYSKIYLRNGSSTLVSRTLLDFENLLVPHGFFRIHRSHLICLKFVARYIKTDGGLVELTDKTQIPVSARFKEDLLSRLLYNKL